MPNDFLDRIEEGMGGRAVYVPPVKWSSKR